MFPLTVAPFAASKAANRWEDVQKVVVMETSIVDLQRDFCRGFCSNGQPPRRNPHNVHLLTVTALVSALLRVYRETVFFLSRSTWPEGRDVTSKTVLPMTVTSIFLALLPVLETSCYFVSC